MTDLDELNHKLWIMIAMALGFNELAKQPQMELGHKVFFRMSRDRAVLDYLEMGGTQSELFKEDQPVVLELRMPEGVLPPMVAFRPRDIEQMRECVRLWDAGELPRSNDAGSEVIRG